MGLDREVEEQDMKDFFLTFMESDALGQIAIAHLQCADQKAEGTLSKACLTLAELHSTSVDFGKSHEFPGIS